jgi:hypothetical protein
MWAGARRQWGTLLDSRWPWAAAMVADAIVAEGSSQPVQRAKSEGFDRAAGFGVEDTPANQLFGEIGR